ncbi:MAG: histidine kinase [Rubrivivax sp.]|nr:histidine kinase [Rubrivivax sp.]
MDGHLHPLTGKLLAASWRSWTSNDLQRVGPGWLQWVWTTAFSAVLAVFFTVLGAALSGGRLFRMDALADWLLWYGRNFVVCFVIAALIHLMFDGARLLLGGPQRIRRLKPWQRSLFFSGIPLLGVAVGWPIGLWASGSAHVVPHVLRSPVALTMTVTLAMGISLALHFYFSARTRQIQAEQRATEAQLRLLQGQIEPHFLFNTLAGVLSLIDHDPAKAKQMLHDFTEVLRSSLTALRNDASPLAHELELAESYLRLLGARMEDRLQWQIDADEAARTVPVPPLLLQPLIENAIHHGLEPQLQGGTVHVSARVQGRELVLEVHDNGRGFDAPARPGVRKGQGLALANVRDRLLSRYGTTASLDVRAAHPGTRAVIRLPIEAAA